MALLARRTVPFRQALLVLAAMLQGCIGTGSAPPRAGQPTVSRPPDYATTRLERLTLAAANEARVTRGLEPLRAHDALSRAARLHSADLARQGRFSHTGTDGSLAADRAERAGVTYRSLGENLYQSSLYASGYEQHRADGTVVAHYDWLLPETLATQAVQAWMDSPGHRANLLNPAFARAGTGVARDGNLGWVVTMLYAD